MFRWLKLKPAPGSTVSRRVEFVRPFACKTTLPPRVPKHMLWRPPESEGKGVGPIPPVNPGVVYVSIERARKEVGAEAAEVRHEAAFKNSFLDFIADKTGYKLNDILKEAYDLGESRFGGHWFGQLWVMDPVIFARFQRALSMAGFSAELHISDSEGPEADSWTVTVRPYYDTNR